MPQARNLISNPECFYFTGKTNTGSYEAGPGRAKPGRAGPAQGLQALQAPLSPVDIVGLPYKPYKPRQTLAVHSFPYGFIRFCTLVYPTTREKH